MYQVLNDKPMTIYGDGNQVRSFSYIDDCLEPLWKAAVDGRASKQIINLGGTKDYTINAANQILKSVIGYGETIYLEPRHEVKYAHPTWKKSIQLLDYSDNTSLEDGLRQMWEWAKEQPMRQQFIWKEYELDNGIYSFWKN
jgi:UDP-glucose 4-epimerase